MSEFSVAFIHGAGSRRLSREQRTRRREFHREPIRIGIDKTQVTDWDGEISILEYVDRPDQAPGDLTNIRPVQSAGTDWRARRLFANAAANARYRRELAAPDSLPDCVTLMSCIMAPTPPETCRLRPAD